MQKWFLQSIPVCQISPKSVKNVQLKIPLSPKFAPQKKAKKNTTRVTRFGKNFWEKFFKREWIFGKIGVAEMAQNPGVFEGYSPNPNPEFYNWVQKILKNKLAPKPEAGAEVMRYTRAANFPHDRSCLGHKEGFGGQTLNGPMASTLTMIPAAIAAGFGERQKMVQTSTPNLGRHSDYLQFYDAPLPISKPQKHIGGMIFFLFSAYVKKACPPFGNLTREKL
ncbi:MAG: hypothetical protein CM15mP85_17870 [Rhodobacterales bacterium]|nr:MAG: hypothetical protein CM15mP85_17870 [Rhodobacterales bacterium]